MRALQEDCTVAKDRRKIEKKRRKEDAKRKRSTARAIARKREASRPTIIVDRTGGDPVFIRRVQEIAAGISLEESGGCPPGITEVITQFMMYGPTQMCRAVLAEAATQTTRERDVVYEAAKRAHAVVAYVGGRVFEQLPEPYQNRLLPDYFFQPLLDPRGIFIRFGFLDRIKRDTGWGYHSRHKPTVTIAGTQWIVCFSAHAVERVVERSNFEENVSYAHYMDCANYFDGCVHFEPVAMADGTPAIRLFMSDGLVGKVSRYREYLRQIAGIDAVDNGPVAAYVLGYCPLDCKGRYAKAISMLYPGYDGTPEDTLVRVADIPRGKKQRLLALADGNKTVRVINEGRYEAIKWYHDHGVRSLTGSR